MDEDTGPELERLRGEIAGLRAELSAVRSDIGSMKSDLAAARGQLSGADGRASRLAESLTALAASTSDGMAEIRASLGRLGDELRHAQEIRTARDRRGDLEKARQERFGRRKDVRELAANLIHFVGTGSVDERVILDAARRRMMDAPDYWLSPAVIAVAAWLADEQDRYASAIAMSLQLDRRKTTLFMALLLRNHASGDALSQWLAAYLSGLAPADLPPEFPVVIDAAAGGALGSDSAARLMRRLESWYQEATGRRAARAEAEEQWRQRLRSLGKPAEATDFPLLAASCSAWEALRERHEVAVVLEAASVHFPDRFTRGADVPADLAKRIGSVLRSLAQAPDAAEEEINREVRRLDAFLETGDGAAGRSADSARDPAAGQPSAVDIRSLVSMSAFPASVDGTRPDPTASELAAIAASASLIAGAVDSLDSQARRLDPIPVRVGRQPQRTASFRYPDDPDLPVADTVAAQAVDCKAQVQAEISAATEAGQRRARRLSRRLAELTLPCTAALGAVPFVISTGEPWIAFVAPAIAIALSTLGWLALAPRRRTRVERDAAMRREAAEGDIDMAAAELTRLFEQDRRGSLCHEELAGFLSALSADDVRRATRYSSPEPALGPRAFPAWTPLPPRQLPPPDDLDV